MKIKKRQIVCLSLVSAVIAPLLWSCKPTEKNYKAAYDVAVKKREMNADGERAEGHRVISVDGPRTVNVGSGNATAVHTLADEPLDMLLADNDGTAVEDNHELLLPGECATAVSLAAAVTETAVEDYRFKIGLDVA